MKGHTFLTKKQREELEKTMSKTLFMKSGQDEFLKRVLYNFPTFKVGKHNADMRILCKESSYEQLGNNRVIIDDNTKKELFYTYYDYPIQEAELYLATPHEEIQSMLIYATLKTTYYEHIRTTPLDRKYLTIKAIMGITREDETEKHKDLNSKQTLEYALNEITKPADLFEVIDNEEIPPNLLKEII